MNSSLLDICFVVSDVLLVSAGIGDGLSSSCTLADMGGGISSSCTLAGIGDGLSSSCTLADIGGGLSSSSRLARIVVILGIDGSISS